MNLSYFILTLGLDSGPKTMRGELIKYIKYIGVSSKPQYGTSQSNLNYYNPWYSNTPIPNIPIHSFPQNQPSPYNPPQFSSYPQYYPQKPQYFSLWQQPQQQDNYQRYLGSLNLPQVGVESANRDILRYPKLPRKVFIGSGGM